MKHLNPQDFGVAHDYLVVSMAELSFSDILKRLNLPDCKTDETFFGDTQRIWKSNDGKNYRSFNILDFYAN